MLKPSSSGLRMMPSHFCNKHRKRLITNYNTKGNAHDRLWFL